MQLHIVWALLMIQNEYENTNEQPTGQIKEWQQDEVRKRYSDYYTSNAALSKLSLKHQSTILWLMFVERFYIWYLYSLKATCIRFCTRTTRTALFVTLHAQSNWSRNQINDPMDHARFLIKSSTKQNPLEAAWRHIAWSGKLRLYKRPSANFLSEGCAWSRRQRLKRTYIFDEIIAWQLTMARTPEEKATVHREASRRYYKKWVIEIQFTCGVTIDLLNSEINNHCKRKQRSTWLSVAASSVKRKICVKAHLRHLTAKYTTIQV